MTIKMKDMGRLKRRQRLPISDVTEPFVSVTEVKHYLLLSQSSLL